MPFPREVMLSQCLAKSGELWKWEKDSGPFDWITVDLFTQQVFVTQVPQPLTASEAKAIISSD